MGRAARGKDEVIRWRARTDESERLAAFLSYSHAADGALAPALQSALQRFAKPWHRLRALRVFRDESSLAATPGLWSSIERALSAADYFILLASPEAARSPWVEREIAFWCAHKPASHVLVVLTDGELAWDRAHGDFDRDRTTALPPALRGVFTEEPRHVDLRWARTHDDLTLAHPEFAACVADLAATLHGRPKDELLGEDVRQHRVTVRLARAAIASLSILALLAGVAALFAVTQRNSARDQRDVALSRQLALQGGDLARSDPTLSVLLGVASSRLSDTLESRSELLQGYDRWRSVSHILTAGRADARSLYKFTQPNAVNSVSYTADGRTLLVGWFDRAVVWDVQRNVRKAVLPGVGLTHSSAISPDGRIVALGAEAYQSDGRITLWDPVSRRRVGRLGGTLTSPAHVGDVDHLAFSPDGRVLASADLGSVMLWDVERRQRLRRINPHEPVTGLAMAPDGRILAIGTLGKGIILWDVARERPIAKLPGPRGALDSLAFSSDGRTIAAGDAEGRIVLSDTKRQRPRVIMRGHGGSRVLGLAFNSHGDILASGGMDDRVALWDLSTHRRIRSLTGHARFVTAVAFGSDTTMLASGGDEGTAIVRRFTGVLLGHRQRVDNVAYHPSKPLLASAGFDGTIILWDTRRQKRLATLRGHEAEVRDVEFSRDGRTLASSSTKDRRIIIWDVQRRRELARLALKDRGAEISLSPDGRTLAAVQNAGAKLWDIRSRRVVATLAPDKAGIDTIATVQFSPDGRLIATGHTNKHATLWDAKRFRRLAVLPGHAHYVGTLAFSPDGSKLATGDTLSRIILWDVRQRRSLGRLRGQHANVGALAFSPDGRMIVASDYGAERIRFWDAASRRSLGAISAGTPVASVAFSPDGRQLALAGDNGSILLRDATPALWRQHLCDIVERDITRAEWRELVAGAPYRRACSGLG